MSQCQMLINLNAKIEVQEVNYQILKSSNYCIALGAIINITFHLPTSST